MCVRYLSNFVHKHLSTDCYGLKEEKFVSCSFVDGVVIARSLFISVKKLVIIYEFDTKIIIGKKVILKWQVMLF